jgi:hypothetical protein
MEKYGVVDGEAEPQEAEALKDLLKRQKEADLDRARKRSPGQTPRPAVHPPG